MAGPTDVPVRKPAVAGLFYPADPERCRELARRFVRGAPRQVQEQAPHRRWIGGIVPHAGWICSGAIAGMTLANLGSATRAGEASAEHEDRADDDDRDGDDVIVVIFAAVHTPVPIELAVLDEFAGWELPGETCAVADELRRRVREDAAGELFCSDNRYHLREHAVEVELPLVREALPGAAAAAILPVEVPLIDAAVEIGRAVARRVIVMKRRAVFLASSDLTHYGPAYHFAPAGVGEAGLSWAKDNDRRLLGLIESFQPERIVSEVREHLNACGGGAIAAMMAACREMGATRAKVLRHANSCETLADVAPQPPDNAVGYAAVVVG